jgi:predicted dehydrogenase
MADPAGDATVVGHDPSFEFRISRFGGFGFPASAFRYITRMSQTHRIAIVGIGAIAGMHARSIADLDNAQLVAGSCRGEAKGRKFAADHGCSWYSDYTAMLDAEQPDVITICTPSGAHLEPALAAFERGIHILCEKPLEITTQRIDQMIAAADGAGVTLGGIFPQRFNPVVQQLHTAAAAGRFGDLAVVNSYVPWWRDDAYYAPDRWQGKLALDGGGAMMNQSIHGVDAVQWLATAAGKGQGPRAEGQGAGADPKDRALPFESPGPRPLAHAPSLGPVEVFAFTGKRAHSPQLIEVEDTAVAVLRFADGTLGQLLGATSMYPGSLKRIQIAGRDGTAELLEDELITWQFRQEQDDDADVRRRFGGKTATGGGAADPMAIDYANHRRNIAAFLDALDGNAPLPISGPEARKAVAIIEALYQSAATGQSVTVA